MAVDPAAVWGKSIADDIAALGITAGTPVTPTQLELLWTTIKAEDRTQLTTKAVVGTVTTSGGLTAIGPPGGPLPIILLPGTGTGGIS